jgi:hypothetical protein
MVRKAQTAAAVVLLVTAASAAQAQTEGAEQIDAVRRDARLHVGPLYVTPTILLRELGVDSNVFNAAGDQVSDFTFTIGPTVTVWIPAARRALFQATGGTDLVYYAKYESERSVDPRVAAKAQVFFNRITLFGEGAYASSRQRLNFEVDLRARNNRENLAAGAEVMLTPKFSLEGAVRRDTVEFDADAVFDGTSLQRTLNQQTSGISATARHRATPLTTFVLKYEQLADRFEFSPARDSNSFRLMPGIEFKPKALISGTAYVGYRKFEPEQDLGLPEFSGLVANLGLSYTLLGATTFGVSYARDLTYSYSEREPFFIANSVGASVRRALGRRFDILLSADRYTYDYENLVTGPAAVFTSDEGRRDSTWNYAGSIGYRIGRDGRIGFGVSYWRRDSTLFALREYDNLRFGTSLTYGF